MPSYLLRVQLADRPGSLGSLAVALGSVGADIVSLDVVERADGYAVDDLVVDLPAGEMPDVLITAAEALSGVRVDSVRPHAGLLAGHRELELINHVSSATNRAEKLRVLAEESPDVLRAAWCAVVTGDETEVRRLATSVAAPETGPDTVPWLPIDGPTALDGTADWVPPLWQQIDTALAAAPLGDPHIALLLGRPGGPEFRPAETVRLGYLAGIIGTILG